VFRFCPWIRCSHLTLSCSRQTGVAHLMLFHS
jgi:hypothetical protein